MADNNKNGLLLAGAALIGIAGFLLLKGKGLKLTLITPSSAKQGTTVDVTLEGSGLTDVTTIKFGEGITVNSFDVESDTQITANITIAGTAVIGVRDVSVSTKAGTSTLTGGFRVETVGALQISNLAVITYW